MKANQWKKSMIYFCCMLLANLALAVRANAYEERREDVEEISAGGGEVVHLNQLAVHEEHQEITSQEETLSYFHP